MAGEPRTCPGRHGDRIRDLDKYLEFIRRCDRNIADAEGDVPLQGFWRGEKAAYQADLSRQDQTACPFA